MFKSIGNLLHRTPWWGLIIGGLLVLVALGMFTTPIHVLRLSDGGKTPAEKSAIKREINFAFGDRALNIAESVVGTMKARATDPDRIRELGRALAEMARARAELARAQAGTSEDTAGSARDAAEAAVGTATAAAEAALESAVEAREAIAEARDDAAEKLQGKGIDATATLKSFDELLKSARESENTARESLAAIRALPRGAPQAAAAPKSPRIRIPSLPTKSTDHPRPAPGASVPLLGAAGAEDNPTPGRTDPARLPNDQPAGKSAKPALVINLDGSATGAILPPDVRKDIRARVTGDMWRIGVGSALILLFIPVFMMLLIAKYFIGRSRRALAFAEEKKQEAMLSDISRQVTEARLQALQAQVEPHFLYNTLANVQALTELDPPAANAMVGHLIQYLRAALPKMRESTSTIGQEVELVTAYLNILKMRMGSRLEFGIEIPQELLSMPFPPMMLPSLVENAVKHGLEPLREGGRIDIVAIRMAGVRGERIRLQVRDTGKGLSAAPVQVGGGVGLANLRERLTGLYGDQARFAIESNLPQGVIATIEIPIVAPLDKSATAGNTAFAGKAEVRPTGWRRVWKATSKTHGIWAAIVSKLFFGLMIALAVVFIIALMALYSGWLPVDIGDLRLHGMEGLALGSVVLLVGFVVSAVAIAIVVAVFYGLGFLFAALLILVPSLILISLFPMMAPFVLIGLFIYWLWRRRRKKAEKPRAI